MYRYTYLDWIKEMTTLLEQEKKQGFSLGMYPSLPDSRDRILKVVSAKLPFKINLTKYTPFIKDQLKCGTCVAKGIGNIMNANLKFKKRMPSDGLSSLYLYKRCKEEDEIPDQEGTFPRIALHIAKTEGVCRNDLLPYIKCSPLPILTDEMKEDALNYKIQGYTRLYGIHEIKAALASGQLVGIGTIVTSQNWLEQEGWILKPEGYLMGLHWTYLDGYDDSLEYAGYKGFLFGVNSWSTEWGMNGRFRMAYDYATWMSPDFHNFPSLTEAWAIDMGVVLPSQEKNVIEMWIGKKEILVNGIVKLLDVPPEIKNGRTLVPLRYVSEELGAKVDWDGKEQKITITY